jgi:hypothetical protein
MNRRRAGAPLHHTATAEHCGIPQRRRDGQVVLSKIIQGTTVALLNTDWVDYLVGVQSYQQRRRVLKRTVQIVLGCATILILCSTVMAQKRRQSSAWGVPEVFSSLSYGVESGDIGGIEVILLPGNSENHAWGVIVIAEGTPGTPQLVEVQVKGARIEFTLTGQEGAYTGKFKGTISPAGLTLWWPTGEKFGLLKRQRSS